MLINGKPAKNYILKVSKKKSRKKLQPRHYYVTTMSTTLMRRMSKQKQVSNPIGCQPSNETTACHRLSNQIPRLTSFRCADGLDCLLTNVEGVSRSQAEDVLGTTLCHKTYMVSNKNAPLCCFANSNHWHFSSQILYTHTYSTLIHILTIFGI